MKRILFVLACLIPLLWALITPTKSENSILIIGDSLSYPYGIRDEDSWVNLLDRRLKSHYPNYKLINYSIPGDESEHALQRLIWALNEYKPKITIIEIGANDGLNNKPIKDIKSNILQMISIAKKNNSSVLLLGMRLPNKYEYSYRKAFSSIYPDLANQEHVAFVPIFLIGVDSNPSLMQNDKLHPVKEAQTKLLETICPTLNGLLKKDHALLEAKDQH